MKYKSLSIFELNARLFYLIKDSKNIEEIKYCLRKIKEIVPDAISRPLMLAGNYDTPLMLAAQTGFIKCINLLIEEKTDVNTRNKEGQTALMIAARHGKPECIKLLISAGADINLQDNKGCTALIHASTKIQETLPLCIEILLQHRVNYQLEDIHGKTALEYCLDSYLGIKNSRKIGFNYDNPHHIFEILSIRMLLEGGATPNHFYYLDLLLEKFSKWIPRSVRWTQELHKFPYEHYYAVITLLLQQQEVLWLEKNLTAARLSDDDYQRAHALVKKLPFPITKQNKDDLEAEIYNAIPRMPKVLTNLISSYDNPYCRLMLILPQLAENKECKNFPSHPIALEHDSSIKFTAEKIEKQNDDICKKDNLYSFWLKPLAKAAVITSIAAYMIKNGR